MRPFGVPEKGRRLSGSPNLTPLWSAGGGGGCWMGGAALLPHACPIVRRPHAGSDRDAAPSLRASEGSSVSKQETFPLSSLPAARRTAYNACHWAEDQLAGAVNVLSSNPFFIYFNKMPPLLYGWIHRIAFHPRLLNLKLVSMLRQEGICRAQ